MDIFEHLFATVRRFAVIPLILLVSITAFAQGPVITSMAPASGGTGTAVTFTGSGFSATPANNIVSFGGVHATVSAASPTSISAPVPLGATFYPPTVTVDGLSAAAGSPFDVTFPTGGRFDSASFDAPLLLPAGLFPAMGLSVTDIDGDGKPDVVIASWAERAISIYRNISTTGSLTASSFADRVTIPERELPHTLVCADLDGDGKPDLAVVNSNFSTADSMTVFRNISTPGTIAFDTGTYYPVPLGPTVIFAADLNSDGKPELAALSYGPDTVSIFTNLSTPGTISFGSAISFRGGHGSQGMVSDDFNGDGKIDLAVTNGESGSVTVYQNSTSGSSVTFAAGVDFPVGLIPYGVKSADFNGDHKPDLLVINYLDNTASVLLNQAAGSIDASSFASQVRVATGPLSMNLSVGDLDGDGKPDFTVINQGDSTISVVRNISTADSLAFAPEFTYKTGPNPLGIEIADLDGDGRPEILNLNNQGNTLAIFRSLLGDQHIITASAGLHGTISPSGAVGVFHEGDQTFSITPATGYTIEDVLVDGSSVGQVASWTFTDVIAPHTISASFAIRKFVITSTSGIHGAISPSGAIIIPYDSTAAFTAIPDAGYHIDSLIVDGALVTPSPSYTFPNVTDIHSIRMTFAPDTLAITVRPVPDSLSVVIDGVQYQGQQTVNWIVGTVHTISADTLQSVSATTRYFWKEWSDAGSRTHAASPVAAQVFSAIFTPQYYLTVDGSPGGTFTPAGGWRDSAAVDTLRAFPSTGYHFTGWLGAGTGSYSGYLNPGIAILHGPVSETATFGIDTLLISASSGLHGSISPSGQVPVTYAAGVTFTFLPDTGYHVDSVIVDGAPVAVAANYRFDTVITSHQIRVVYRSDHHAVTVTHSSHGNVAPGSVIVTDGATQRFVFTPDIYFAVHAVTVDGVSADDSTAGYTITNIKVDHLVDVQFIEMPHSQSLAVSAGWNLLSLPVKSVELHASILFPTASSRAFSYAGRYVPEDTLTPGTGYWVKFTAAGTVPLSGFRVMNDTAAVSAGWNLIGAVDRPVPVVAVTSIPSGMSTSRFFAYEGHYVNSDTLQPGKGYWVKTSGSGFLAFGTNAPQAPLAKQSLRMVLPGEPPAPPSETDQVAPGPLEYSLKQNYPNPFNPVTKMYFVLGTSSFVSLKVYDILGREVATLVNLQMEAGKHSVVWDASGMPSGVYFYKLTAGEFTDVKRMVLVK